MKKLLQFLYADVFHIFSNENTCHLYKMKPKIDVKRTTPTAEAVKREMNSQTRRIN